MQTALPFGSEGELRTVSLYLPTAREQHSMLPVVFCTDGEATPLLAAAMMAAPDVPRAILVGIHSSRTQRAQEYLLGSDAEVYAAHETFFVQQVREWIAIEQGVDAARERCGIFGVSNGAAFALWTGTRRAEAFSVVIAFSIARTSPKWSYIKPGQHPSRYYLAAGNVGPERMFGKYTASVAKELQRHGVEHTFAQRTAGHEWSFWQTEFANALRRAFPTSY